MARALVALPAALGLLKSGPLRCEDDTLPRWLGGVSKDPSRQAKIKAYDDAQDAAARNNVLPKRRGIRLVSYNLHFLRDSQMNPNLDRVLQVLRQLDADILALQEAGLPEGTDAGQPGRTEVMKAQRSSVDPVASVEELTRQSFAFREEAVIGFGSEGTRLLDGLKQMGYTHCIYAPAFYSSTAKLPCGNAVVCKQPMTGEVVMLDRGRFGEDRTAAVARLALGDKQEPFAIASAHLDVWAEMRGYFGMAEGEAIRLLEFEALHQALKEEKNLMILGDFNTPSQLTAELSEEHRRQAQLLDRLSHQRDPQALRHFLPRDAPRIPQEMTALGFAERLGYRHAWQELEPPVAPFYSHWSGQLIDHCLMRCSSKLRVSYVGVYHTSASDHLPLVIDFEFE